MIYDEVLTAIDGLVGEEVVLVMHLPEWDDSQRPYRGTLARWPGTREDVAVFSVEHDRDDGWANPTGVAFALFQDSFSAGARCGGPARRGITFVQQRVRISLYPNL